MNGMKTEEMGSRKKYLAPVVVLLLCLVSLTGAAYAYSASMTNNSNSLEADYISIDLSTPTTPTSSITPGDSLITFSDNFTYKLEGEPAAWVRGNTVNYELASPVDLVKYKVTIDGTADFTKFKVSSESLVNKVLFEETKVSDLFSIKYTVKDATEENTIVTATVLGEAAAKGTLAAGTYVVIISAVATGETEGTVDTFEDMSVEGKTASEYQGAVGTLSYDLKFELLNEA